MLQFDVIIPTRGSLTNLESIINCILKQTILPNKIFILIDKVLSKSEFWFYNYRLLKLIGEKNSSLLNIVSNLNSDFIPTRWVSSTRNYGINLSTSDYLYLLDDDNIFQKDFFAKTIDARWKIYTDIGKDYLLSPTISYRKTSIVQSRWIKNFNYFLSKVELNKDWSWEYKRVKMIGWNSLFWKSYVFKDNLFDEKFEFVYEDLDFTYRCYRSGYPIVVSNTFSINHMERNKTKIEKSFIWDEKTIYQKSRNRIFFVRKNANVFEKILFFIFWMNIQNIWFLYLILFYWKNKKSLIKWLLFWVIDWIRKNI